MPLVALGVSLFPIEALLSHQEINHRVPRHEHQIGVADFVANEIFIASLLEMSIDHA